VLARTMALWSQLDPHSFPNGVVMFCCKELAEVLHPLQPLPHHMFSCGRTFDTSLVSEALEVRQSFTHGVIVLDGDEATWGVVQLSSQGKPSIHSATQLGHLYANIPSRTRRGGQSATRYARNRDGEELAFLRKIAERASEEFGGIRSVLVGGRGDMKRKLLPELPQQVRERVVCVIDIGCSAGPEGLQKVATHVPEVAGKSRRRALDEVVVRFLELVAETDAHEAPLVCYGEAQTAAALRIGAVEHLVVASSHSSAAWADLAKDSGATYFEIEPTTELSLRFCQGYGVGACLRYAVDPEFLEISGGDLASDEEVKCLPVQTLRVEKPARVSLPMQDPSSDCESVSTATSGSDVLLLKWLESSLKRALQDAAAAESLTMCADVLLFDANAATDQERLDTTVEMLRGEGVSEDVLAELVCHVADLIDDPQ